MTGAQRISESGKKPLGQKTWPWASGMGNSLELLHQDALRPNSCEPVPRVSHKPVNLAKRHPPCPADLMPGPAWPPSFPGDGATDQEASRPSPSTHRRTSHPFHGVDHNMWARPNMQRQGFLGAVWGRGQTGTCRSRDLAAAEHARAHTHTGSSSC